MNPPRLDRLSALLDRLASAVGRAHEPALRFALARALSRTLASA